MMVALELELMIMSTGMCRFTVGWNDRLNKAFPDLVSSTERAWQTDKSVSHVQAEQVPSGGELAQLQSAARTAAEPRKGRDHPLARPDSAGAPTCCEPS